MSTAINTLTGAQQKAIDAILAAQPYSDRQRHQGTVLNRKARVVGAIRRRHDKALAKMGFATRDITQSWQDVVDIAKLQQSAEEA